MTNLTPEQRAKYRATRNRKVHCPICDIDYPYRCESYHVNSKKHKLAVALNDVDYYKAEVAFQKERVQKLSALSDKIIHSQSDTIKALKRQICDLYIELGDQ